MVTLVTPWIVSPDPVFHFLGVRRGGPRRNRAGVLGGNKRRHVASVVFNDTTFFERVVLTQDHFLLDLHFGRLAGASRHRPNERQLRGGCSKYLTRQLTHPQNHSLCTQPQQLLLSVPQNGLFSVPSCIRRLRVTLPQGPECPDFFRASWRADRFRKEKHALSKRGNNIMPKIQSKYESGT